MKILILSQWYAPEPANVLCDLAAELQRRGHQIQVLTGFPNYPAGKLYPGYKLRLWQKEVLNGIPVVRTILYPDHSQSAVKRILNYLSFSCSSAIFGPWLADRPDVIFVLSTPYLVGIPAWLMSRLWGAPFVFNVQDLWPETLEATGMVRSSFALRLVGGLAGWVYRKAAAVIVISPGFRKNLLAKGVPDEKIQVISNWVDTEHYRPCDPDGDLAQQLGLAGRFNVMFAGTMGKAQGLETVIQAARQLQANTDLQFVFVGDGVEAARLRALAEQFELSNVHFFGWRAEDEMPQLLGLADALLVHLVDDPLFRITIPHKIFAYAASGKPILCAVRGDAADVVTSAGAGIACPPGIPEALAEAVQQLFEMSPEARGQMGQRGRLMAVEHYTRDVLVGRIERALQSVSDRYHRSLPAGRSAWKRKQ